MPQQPATSSRPQQLAQSPAAMHAPAAAMAASPAPADAKASKVAREVESWLQVKPRAVPRH
jgi:hypothetical protein